jgi:hypothetical protein
MMRYSHYLLGAALCGIVASATPALAINCDGNFQVQKSGQRIATPYCEDDNLAAVAREYGAHTTANEMRWNPSEKSKICHFVGEDNRVRDTCLPYREDGRDNFWR